MAARQGLIPMVAFFFCLHVWLATSLLADGLAVVGQAILASAFARKDHQRATAAASRVLQWGMVLGFVLCAVLGIGLQFASKLFTKDVSVLQLIHIGIQLKLLGVFYSSLNSPSQLSGWTSNDTDPCGESWKEVTCYGLPVSGVYDHAGLCGAAACVSQPLRDFQIPICSLGAAMMKLLIGTRVKLS